LRESASTPRRNAPDLRRFAAAPLDAASRRFFEPRFGHDFANVRIHTGRAAAASARELDAAAYTQGEHIVFGAGAFRPGSLLGDGLIAHELTHVVQGRNAPAPSRLLSQPDSRAEMQADDIARRLGSGRVLGCWRPVASSALINPAPESWYRGYGEGVPVAKDAKPGERGVVHDLGDGTYFSDKFDVAKDVYAEGRAKKFKTTARVVGGEIERAELGRVLDLTKDADFMKVYEIITRGIPSPSGEPYRRAVDHHLKLKGQKYEDFDAIIGSRRR
jgi:hypothetical protein